MANRINAGAASQSLTSYPRVVKNLVEEDLRTSGGLSVVTTGTSTITPDSDNAGATFSCGASDRAFVAGTFSAKVGKAYLIGMRVANYTGNAPTRPMIWSNGDIVAGGDADIVTTGSNGVWTSYYESTSQKTVTFRIGFGASNQDEDANARSCDISEIFAYELDSLPAVTTGAVPGPCELIDELPGGNAYVGGFDYTYAASGLMTQGNGSLAYNTERNRFKVGFFISDSFGNTVNEWPQQLVNLEEGMLLLGHATSGQALSTVVSSSIHTELMDFDSFTYNGTANPDFIIIQSSINDANTGRTAQQMLDDMEAIIDAAKTRGLACIVTNATPFDSGMSAAEGQVIAEYNYRLTGLCFAKSVIHVDLYGLLTDSGVPERFSPTYYVSGDQSHPKTPEGHIRIAEELLKAIKKLRGGVLYAPSP